MTKYLKYIYYAFFILAILFIYEAIKAFNSEDENALMYLGFAGILIFYGWFRLRYMKKFNKYKQEQEDKK